MKSLAITALIAVAAPAAAQPVAAPVAAQRIDATRREALRRRLSAVGRAEPGFARARLVLGALELGDERPEAAARALEEALAAGLRPRPAALSLLAWSYGRAGDRPRAARAIAAWGAAPRPVVAALAGPWLEATAALGGGYDTNVRLDVDSLGAGVDSPWLGGWGLVQLRPLRRRDALELRLAMEQRLHWMDRSRTSLYDLGRALLGATGSVGLLDESLRLSAQLVGHEEMGDGLGRHLAQGASLELRAGWHPVGPHEVGVYGALALRDLDGAGLGDRQRDEQDAALVDAGAYVEGALARTAARASLALGYHQEVARSSSWDARGLAARGTGSLSTDSVTLSLESGWRWRRFEGARPADEHRLALGLELSVAIGPARPFLRGALERSVGADALRYDRAEIGAGIAVTGRIH